MAPRYARARARPSSGWQPGSASARPGSPSTPASVSGRCGSARGSAYPRNGRPTRIPIPARWWRARASCRSALAKGCPSRRVGIPQAGPLVASCEYRVAGFVPPTRYWTLTAQTPDGALIANPAGRHGFTTGEIVRDADGSFVVNGCGEGAPGNWLPVAGGRFDLVLRLYDTPISGASTVVDGCAHAGDHAQVAAHEALPGPSSTPPASASSSPGSCIWARSSPCRAHRAQRRRQARGLCAAPRHDGAAKRPRRARTRCRTAIRPPWSPCAATTSPAGRCGARHARRRFQSFAFLQRPGAASTTP